MPAAYNFFNTIKGLSSLSPSLKLHINFYNAIKLALSFHSCGLSDSSMAQAIVSELNYLGHWDICPKDFYTTFDTAFGTRPFKKSFSKIEISYLLLVESKLLCVE